MCGPSHWASYEAGTTSWCLTFAVGHASCPVAGNTNAKGRMSRVVPVASDKLTSGEIRRFSHPSDR